MSTRAAKAPALLGAITPVLAGYSPVASALEPFGEGAAQISFLIWLFVGVCALVWLAVMAALAVGLRHANAPPALSVVDPIRERRYQRFVIVAVSATAVIIVALTLVSFFTGRSLARLGETPTTSIEVTGHQWWWEAKYPDPRPDRVFTTANEIHLPANELVELRLRSSDVIHSFWAPSLAGKEDLIPGQNNVLRVIARRPGVYRGQCAEFCGFQHAHMAILVVAEPREEFDKWRERQLAPVDAAGPDRQAGEKIFTSGPCAMCHRIRGTTAAGALQMSRGNLAAWIADPQGIKPGAKMPTMNLSPDELNHLVDYLEGLR